MIRPAKAALPRLSGYAVSRNDRMMKNEGVRKCCDAVSFDALKRRAGSPRERRPPVGLAERKSVRR